MQIFMNNKLKEKIKEFELAYKIYWHLTWLSLLKTYLVSLGTNFSYILKDKKFNWVELYHNNILLDLEYQEIGILYEYFLSYKDHTDKNNKGQFYTPTDVATFMWKQQSYFRKMNMVRILFLNMKSCI